MFNTILTKDWLKNNIALELNFSTLKEEATYKEYYLKTCQLIHDVFYLEPTPSEIEEYLKNGEVTIKNIKIVCRIKNREDREYLFLLAQAKYLEYEKYNGKGGMISDGTARAYKYSDEVIDIIKQLGLYQRSFAVV